jgi:hypothetical protein
MKTSTFIALCVSILAVNIGAIIQNVRHERLKGNISNLNKLQQEERLKACEQAAIQDELCGIVRRLGVRVGRLEESQMSPPSNPLLPMVKEVAE